MAIYENTIDFTVNLPDELLQEVFGYLPLRDKLRLESVSHRFQRCILDMFERKPLPLELDAGNDTLNGYNIRVGSLLDALRSFAYKAKFNSIDIRFGSFGRAGPKINSILPVLIDSENCLEKVVSFKTDCGCRQNILEMFTAKCPKLSVFGLGYAMFSPKDLGTAFNNKALAQLDLAFIHSDTEDMLLLFQSLKPNTLQKLQILFHGLAEFDPAKLVDELRTNAWAALQELKMEIDFGNMQVAPFFDALALLPSLNKCEIDIIHQGNNQFMAAMKSLFKSSITISVRSFGRFFRALPGCQIISQIQQIQTWAAQTLNLALIVDFRPRPTHERYFNLKLSLNNVLVEEIVRPIYIFCANAHCVDCHRFYPNVFWRLAIEADRMVDCHLEEFQLDKCRIGDVVDHLKHRYGSERFLPTGASETQDLVTIGFKTRHQPSQEFNITVASGRCFSNSCVKCIDI